MYVRIMCTLAPSTFVAPLVETIADLRHFHPLAEVDLSFFVNDFHLEMDFVLNREAFISTLTCLPCCSFDDPLGMVYEFLWDYFVLDDFANGFNLFLKYVGTSFMVIFLHQ